MSHSVNGLLDSGDITVTSEKKLTNIQPNQGSQHGGLVVRIDGNGFPKDISDLSVKLGSGDCEVTGGYGNSGEIYCKTPEHSAGSASISIHVMEKAANFPALSFTYDQVHSPTVTSITPSNGETGTAVTISGTLFKEDKTSVTIGDQACNLQTVTTTSIQCTIPEMAAGVYDVQVLNTDHGYSNADIKFTGDFSVSSVTPLEASFGGGREITIAGKGFSAKSAVTICDEPCLDQSATYSEVKCVVPRYPGYTAGVSTTIQCDLIVDGTTFGSKFVFKDSLTPTLDDIIPKRSGTGGGVSITLTGSNFDAVSSNVEVFIDGVPCSVTSSSLTQIICTTGSTKETNMAAKVVVKVTGKGEAAVAQVDGDKFEYIDVWSSPHTWGGEVPPVEGGWVFVHILFLWNLILRFTN